MQQFRKILVGIDLASAAEPSAAALGEPTREAVRRGVWLAGRTDAELTFFAAEDVEQLKKELTETSIDTTQIVTFGNRVLEELVEDARCEDVDATGKLEFGNSWEAIIREVVRNGHDLMIVGTRDRGAAARWLFGSTAMKLLRNCPCPVWVTRPDPNEDDFSILVACDLTEVSQRALHIAVGGAQLADAKLHVLHVVDNKFDRRMWFSGEDEQKLQQHRESRRAEAEARIHEQLSQTDYRTLSWGVQVHVVEGSPEMAVLDAIDEFGIDLLIMGTAARTGIAGILVGNTAERLLSQVQCSVLAIKPGW